MNGNSDNTVVAINQIVKLHQDGVITHEKMVELITIVAAEAAKQP